MNKERSLEWFKNWVKRINGKDLNPSKHVHACSVHFSEDNYELSSYLKSSVLKNKITKNFKKDHNSFSAFEGAETSRHIIEKEERG